MKYLDITIICKRDVLESLLDGKSVDGHQLSKYEIAFLRAVNKNSRQLVLGDIVKLNCLSDNDIDVFQSMLAQDDIEMFLKDKEFSNEANDITMSVITMLRKMSNRFSDNQTFCIFY